MKNDDVRIDDEHFNSNKEGVRYIAFDGNFIGSTEFVKETENLRNLLSSYCGENTDRFAISGLHTCGNLSPTCVKLYCQDSNAVVLCNVACCYHLLVEEFALDFSYINKCAKSFVDHFKEGCCARKYEHPRSDDRYHKPEFDPFYSRTNGAERHQAGFPLCFYLRNVNFSLRKNARDLASKPPSQFCIESEVCKFAFILLLLNFL